MALLLATSAANAQTIAVSTAKLDTYRAILLDAIKASAKAQPGVTVTVDDAKGDSQTQLAHLRKYAEDKVSAIIVIPSDGDMGPQLTEIAQKAGIPLIYVNTEPANLADLPDNQVLVASNEKESGTLETAEVCRLMKGKGKAVVLMGEPFHSAARARTQDVDDVLARPECQGIQIVERQAAYWSRDDADQQMREWLKAGVAFDAVIANNDEMALGAIRALKQAGRPMKDVVVAGVDATDDALAAMVAGDLDVTILQNAAGQGKAAIDAALKLAKGEKVPRENYVPFELVTPENVAKYLPKSQ
ncbi:rhizopine-binding protein [Xaviernesmea oryzae]|uniref:Rhizopine-binding protein n=2 Tax=Xaviernesmea oryzae TaxID=464029 RepID=A0A1Q9B1E1_9HYPH|nr:substrate-binding domain-containing protein [Xaviernesmea oryzae]OLP61823.1 rhizopine-binding protein [Xaviernesmea oryzae]SEL76336.1 inositol transport system substrate-binding protein [Xaviernesmea oryzae]